MTKSVKQSSLPYLVYDDMLMTINIYGILSQARQLTVISSNAVPLPERPVPSSNILRAIPLVAKVRQVFLVVLLSNLIE